MFLSTLIGRLPAVLPLALALVCSAGAFSGTVALMASPAGLIA